MGSRFFWLAYSCGPKLLLTDKLFSCGKVVYDFEIFNFLSVLEYLLMRWQDWSLLRLATLCRRKSYYWRPRLAVRWWLCHSLSQWREWSLPRWHCWTPGTGHSLWRAGAGRRGYPWGPQRGRLPPNWNRCSGMSWTWALKPGKKGRKFYVQYVCS